MLSRRRSSRTWRAEKAETSPPRSFHLRGIRGPARRDEVALEDWLAAIARGGGGRRPSGQLVALALLRVCGLALLTLAFVALTWPYIRGRSGRASDGATIVRREVGPAPKVLSLVVERSRPDDPDHSSMIGVSSWEGRGGELVRVTARLDHPAYCYLMALDSDGEIRLVDPPDRASPPSPRSEIRHPAGPGHGTILPDAAGLQGWLLVAAARPLPPFEDWSEAPLLRWRTVLAEGVLRFDGSQVQRFGPGPCRVPWSLSASPRPFARLCAQVSQLPELDAVEAIVYPVRPRAR